MFPFLPNKYMSAYRLLDACAPSLDLLTVFAALAPPPLLPRAGAVCSEYSDLYIRGGVVFANNSAYVGGIYTIYGYVFM